MPKRRRESASGSAHPVAAIDVVGLGDDVIRLGRGEENRHAGQVFGTPHAPEGNGIADQPLNCVAYGAGKALDYIGKWDTVFTENP